MGLKDRIKRLERAAEQETIVIPQRDGTVKKFSSGEAADAIPLLVDGRDHPIADAARNSSDPAWRSSFYSAFPLDPDTPDLSEP